MNHLIKIVSFALLLVLVGSCASRSSSDDGPFSLKEARRILSPDRSAEEKEEFHIYTISGLGSVSPEVWALITMRLFGEPEDARLVEPFLSSEDEAEREAARQAMDILLMCDACRRIGGSPPGECPQCAALAEQAKTDTPNGK